ncbi:Uncharacterized protein APZ42_031359 [Daphnia magna]|uniref:THAP-type domain-containing protein n=1 Tax=Daphnia magna TaxID=35525 RepID=A0A164MXC4_9CRUS|nr:Uncharacterized protein APZ42_031359 [Daphnia magna]
MGPMSKISDLEVWYQWCCQHKQSPHYCDTKTFFGSDHQPNDQLEKDELGEYEAEAIEPTICDPTAIYDYWAGRCNRWPRLSVMASVIQKPSKLFCACALGVRRCKVSNCRNTKSGSLKVFSLLKAGQQRDLWLKRMAINDGNGSMENLFVCSLHFVLGIHLYIIPTSFFPCIAFSAGSHVCIEIRTWPQAAISLLK